jgi:glycosyltransferase involved in cell wall biosynthesis
MKIVVVASLAYSLVNFRGRLLGEMRARGHQVTACAPDDDPDVVARLDAMGIAFRQIPMARAGLNPFGDLRTLASLVGVLRRERPDIVLAYTQKPIVYSGIAARLVGGTRFFAMMSGLGYAFGPDGSGWLRKIVATLYRVALDRAETVFVFNADDKPEMLRNRMLRPDARIVQVPGSGIDLAQFRETEVPAGPMRFLMIARLLRSKGVYEYLEAARRVKQVRPDARFALLGPLDPNPDGIGTADVAAWSREGAIEYLGETRDVRPFLQESSVFVLPSWYREGLPRTILEAMAIGRAIVTTDMPGCREPIDPGRNGFLVAPKDSRSLAMALMRFVDDPGLAITMGRQSRAKAADCYSVETVNDIILSTMKLEAPEQRWAPTPGLRLAGAAS